jgi:hypothetical protein
MSMTLKTKSIEVLILYDKIFSRKIKLIQFNESDYLEKKNIREYFFHPGYFIIFHADYIPIS